MGRLWGLRWMGEGTDSGGWGLCEGTLGIKVNEGRDRLRSGWIRGKEFWGGGELVG